jgi:hypothetical protein
MAGSVADSFSSRLPLKSANQRLNQSRRRLRGRRSLLTARWVFHNQLKMRIKTFLHDRIQGLETLSKHSENACSCCRDQFSIASNIVRSFRDSGIGPMSSLECSPIGLRTVGT